MRWVKCCFQLVVNTLAHNNSPPINLISHRYILIIQSSIQSKSQMTAFDDAELLVLSLKII